MGYDKPLLCYPCWMEESLWPFVELGQLVRQQEYLSGKAAWTTYGARSFAAQGAPSQAVRRLSRNKDLAKFHRHFLF